MPVVVYRHASTPAYRQLADALRREIVDGRLRPGDKLPTEASLQHVHSVGRATVREALRLLREEGLIDRVPGSVHVVREQPTRRRRPLPRRAVVVLRMPNPQERLEFQIPDGVPVADVTAPDGKVRFYIGDRDELAT